MRTQKERRKLKRMMKTLSLPKYYVVVLFMSLYSFVCSKRKVIMKTKNILCAPRCTVLRVVLYSHVLLRVGRLT